MHRALLVAVAALALAGIGAGSAGAATSELSIDRKSELLAGLAVELQVTVSCSAPELSGPISLSVSLQQLQKAGGGADETIVNGSGFQSNISCDGVARTYAVLVRTFAPAGQPLPLFRHGQALATATLYSCGTTVCTSLGSQSFAEVRISK